MQNKEEVEILLEYIFIKISRELKAKKDKM